MKWIKCEDAMPRKYKTVLVWVIYRNQNESFCESWFDGDEWAMGSAKNFTVTHWMRIVEPK